MKPFNPKLAHNKFSNASFTTNFSVNKLQQSFSKNAIGAMIATGMNLRDLTTAGLSSTQLRNDIRLDKKISTQLTNDKMMNVNDLLIFKPNQ